MVCARLIVVGPLLHLDLEMAWWFLGIRVGEGEAKSAKRLASR